jgi:outer membrane protein TolC
MKAILRGAALLLFALQAPAAAQSLSVSEAARLTVERHPLRAVARAGVARAEAAVRDANASRLPLIMTDANLTRFQEPMVIAPLHGFDPGNPPQFDRTLVQASVSASYTLYDGGARGARIDRAATLVTAAEAGDASVQGSLLADAVRTYLDVATTREVAAVHRERIAAVTKERDRAAQLLREGRAARVVLMRAEAALNAALADQSSAEANAEVAQRELARLTGLDMARIRTDTTIAMRRSPADTLFGGEAALDRARESNPELLRLRRQLAAAERGRTEARALWLPRVNLGGRYVEYAAANGNARGEWQGAMQLSYPLLTGGTRAAAAERAEAEIAGARAELAAAELRIEEALDRAIAARAPTNARIQALTSAVAQAEEVVRIERLALDAGSGVQSEFLTAVAELFRVRAALSEANAAAVRLRVDIARISGELSLAWIASNL